jgi:hypothetical protein
MGLFILIYEAAAQSLKLSRLLKLNKTLSGCVRLLKVPDVSGTISVPIIGT